MKWRDSTLHSALIFESFPVSYVNESTAWHRPFDWMSAYRTPSLKSFRVVSPETTLLNTIVHILQKQFPGVAYPNQCMHASGPVRRSSLWITAHSSRATEPQSLPLLDLSFRISEPHHGILIFVNRKLSKTAVNRKPTLKLILCWNRRDAFKISTARSDLFEPTAKKILIIWSVSRKPTYFRCKMFCNG